MLVLICPTTQEERLRHFGTTGSLRMARMRFSLRVLATLQDRTPLSSLRTQGPIPRDVHWRKERSRSARATNCALWLWVPAFAGTTEEVAALSVVIASEATCPPKPKRRRR